MSKINPTFYIDMQNVFQTERNRQDSERYIEKLKKCEDTIIKAPTKNDDVLYELQYEKTRMIIYQKNLKYKRKIKVTNKKIKEKFNFYKQLKRMKEI